MDEWCNVLLVLLSQLALWVNNLWSWLLENVGGSFSAWWARQVKAVKVLILAGVTILLGAGAWSLGQFVFACAGWMSISVAAFMIVSAIAGLFIGGKRYEAGKADRYEAAFSAAQDRIASLLMQVEALEAALAQARRDMA